MVKSVIFRVLNQFKLSIFTDNYKTEIEAVFDKLIDMGFEKQFSHASGRESMLTYVRDVIAVQLVWETKTSNPWVMLMKRGENTLDFAQIELTLREKHPSISNNPNVFHYWLLNTLPLNEYLEVYFDQVISDLDNN